MKKECAGGGGREREKRGVCPVVAFGVNGKPYLFLYWMDNLFEKKENSFFFFFEIFPHDSGWALHKKKALSRTVFPIGKVTEVLYEEYVKMGGGWTLCSEVHNKTKRK